MRAGSMMERQSREALRIQKAVYVLLKNIAQDLSLAIKTNASLGSSGKRVRDFVMGLRYPLRPVSRERLLEVLLSADTSSESSIRAALLNGVGPQKTPELYRDLSVYAIVFFGHVVE